MQAHVVNNSCGAVKVNQHSLLPNLPESQGLNVHVVKQSSRSSRSHLDSQLAIASANVHVRRTLKAFSIWLENLGRGRQERWMCSESPKYSNVTALGVHGKFSAVFLSLCSREFAGAPWLCSKCHQ